MEKKKFKFGLGGWIFVAMVAGILVGLACIIVSPILQSAKSEKA